MYQLSMDEQLVLQSLKEFVEEEVKPAAMDLDKSGEWPRKLWDRASELGFVGATLPEEYGGMGMSTLLEMMMLEELAKESPVLAFIIDAHHAVFRQIYYLATPEQKEKYLYDMAAGTKIGAIASTDPAGSSNQADWPQFAVPAPDGSGLLVNTTKVFTTNSNVADIFVMAGRFGDSQAQVIIEKGTPGLITGQVERKMGMNGSGTGTLRCVDVLVPFEDIMIPDKFTMDDAIDFANLYADICAVSLGLAEAAFEKTRVYLKNRMRNGKPLAGYQVVAHQLADMKCKIELCRSLLYRVAEAHDTHSGELILIHIAKATIPEIAIEIAEMAIKLHGGVGYMEETGIARYLRDAFCNVIGELPTAQHMDQIALHLDLPIDTTDFMFASIM